MQQTLKMLLDKMNTEVNNYLTLLRQERDLLQTEDINRLDDVRVEKDALIDQIAHYDSAISALITENAQAIERVIVQKGLESNQKMTALIELVAEPDRVELAQIWAKVRPQLTECQRLHAVNGSVMASRLNSIRRTLNLMMHGQEETSVAYDDKGQL